MRLTMRKPLLLTLTGMVIVVAVAAHAATPTGDAKRGAELFRACAACHSFVPDRNMTGPSLAVWDRQAGSLKSFERYSPALKISHVVWDEKPLDEWLKSPSRFIPQNRMTFAGISDARQRADLIAFLKEASSAQTSAENSGQAGGMGAMRGGAGAQFGDLKKLGPDHQVQAIRYCHDTYQLTTGRRQEHRLLGAQSALQDRFQRDRPAQRKTRHHARRHDG